MDRGACKSLLHGVAKSQTSLSTHSICTHRILFAETPISSFVNWDLEALVRLCFESKQVIGVNVYVGCLYMLSC